MTDTKNNRSAFRRLLDRLVGRLRWRGWRAFMIDNPEPYRYPGQQWGFWKLHRCPDGHQCRAQIGGGCATGYCAHYKVKPDDEGVPRYPRSRLIPPNDKA